MRQEKGMEYVCAVPAADRFVGDADALSGRGVPLWLSADHQPSPRVDNVRDE